MSRLPQAQPRQKVSWFLPRQKLLVCFFIWIKIKQAKTTGRRKRNQGWHSLPIITNHYQSLPIITIHYHSLPWQWDCESEGQWECESEGLSCASMRKREGLRNRGSAKARDCVAAEPQLRSSISERVRKRGTAKARGCASEGVCCASERETVSCGSCGAAPAATLAPPSIAPASKRERDCVSYASNRLRQRVSCSAATLAPASKREGVCLLFVVLFLTKGA